MSIFDTDKGKHIYPRRTVCEVHREIYDLAVIYLFNQPEQLAKMTVLLEEAFLMGIKMNKKLVEHKLSSEADWPVSNTNGLNRAERERLLTILNQNNKVLSNAKSK
jgi:hypothetical protein